MCATRHENIGHGGLICLSIHFAYSFTHSSNESNSGDQRYLPLAPLIGRPIRQTILLVLVAISCCLLINAMSERRYVVVNLCWIRLLSPPVLLLKTLSLPPPLRIPACHGGIVCPRNGGTTRAATIYSSCQSDFFHPLWVTAAVPRRHNTFMPIV